MPGFAHLVRRSLADWLLTVEALLLLAIFRAALALVPVRRIIAAVTHRAETGSSHVDASPAANPQTEAAARRVQWAISAAARHSPVEFVCFPQALAGYAMLRRRHVPSTLVYGVARSPGGQLLAHTWLTVGDNIILGREAADGFKPLQQWT